MMRAVICNNFDGVDSLVLGTMDSPKPRADQVLVDVHAASISFMDCLMVAGKYQLRPQTPFVPGTDAAGVVAEVGSEVTRFKPGDRVICGSWSGCYAERVVASQDATVLLPDGVDFETGSIVRHCYGTARYALLDCARLRAGEAIFISGAAGGVGLAAVDLARHLGATIIAGVGTPDKAGITRAYGAQEVIVYGSEGLRQRIKDITGGKGVDVFFDNVGGEIFSTMTRLMNWGGRMLPVGFTSGEIVSVPMNLPLLKNYSVVGSYWGAWAERFPQASLDADAQLLAWVAQGSIKPHVSASLPLEEFRTGMHKVTQRSAQGRTVLRVR